MDKTLRDIVNAELEDLHKEIDYWKKQYEVQYMSRESLYRKWKQAEERLDKISEIVGGW